ncbi:chaperone modulator CbpM [Flavisolibacter ginsenosidimutans]|uniref:MerR family transcriptional regulator n=1 Tax=Flavisolibacter ginsenosidimutans TaxID=661481 RepID=A0A5B8UGR3_9BACT|nr:chaperone modulator CbpM [Flavisolibacter ginsenosidimutans]QEC55851.1 hypothetical protein FSB75_08065 [Flavisolibacter ginsenosidimutans]
MSREELISANDFCTHHRIEISFLQSLQNYGLVEMTTVEHNVFLHPEQLSEVEKFIRLHYDLHVNMEGLDVIRHMLERMESLQKEASSLRNRLRFYEE